MRIGYWLPVFCGWLRNVVDEGMATSWPYVRDLAQRSEALGYDLTLVAELNLNDIKGADAPRVIGFDAFARLADYLVAEAEAAERAGDDDVREARVATNGHGAPGGVPNRNPVVAKGA